ncbi:prepilin-type N-terminal cleavage/methylation domain-containing protein [Catenovulum sp. SM1970]|uniref:type IV pilin protein n=1 Tax=Marinifaba aquimaris TaxID=2741323 RepID=UPI0015732D7C|nr:type IV pilin protein [Marinifaba aquimaris]NTS76722.1 prepilin-type N-terminal cleavage/methylation domain-containing protein [Marinifaba aquimaris]
MQQLQKQQGITLVELMVTIAIVGILTAVAVPAYTSYISQSFRSAALLEIARVANLQEEFFADRNTYTTAIRTNFGLPGTNEVYDVTADGANQVMYQITVAAVNNITDDYIITATAVGAQATNDTECRTMTLNSFGQKDGTDSNGTANGLDCWQ